MADVSQSVASVLRVVRADVAARADKLMKDDAVLGEGPGETAHHSFHVVCVGRYYYSALNVREYVEAEWGGLVGQRCYLPNDCWG